MKIVRVLKKSPNETRVKGGTNFLWSPFIQYKTSKLFFFSLFIGLSFIEAARIVDT